MQITNGTVSRTYKPADYEGRTVTYSFTLEPADDADVQTAKVALLAEKHARHMPTQAEEQAALKTRAPRAVPPQPTTTTPVVSGTAQTAAASASGPDTVGTSDPFGAAGAPASSAPTSAPVSDTASNKAQPTPATEITDAMLQERIKAKVASDAKHTQGVLDLIFFFTKNRLTAIYKVTDQEQRAEFLARLAAL